MKWIYNLKISRKLSIFAGFAIAIFAILTTVSFFATANLGRLQNEGDSRAREAMLARSASSLGVRMYTVIADTVINRNLMESATEWEEVKSNGRKELKEIISFADTEEETEWANEAIKVFENIINLYETDLLPIIKISSEVTEDITAIDGKIDESIGNMSNLLIQFSDSLVGEANEADKVFDEKSKEALVTTVIISLIASIMLLIFSLRLIRNITKPLQDATAAADSLARGDINITLEENGKDEIGSLIQSFNRMSANFREQSFTVEKIADGDYTASIAVRCEEDSVNKAINLMVNNTRAAMQTIRVAAGQVSAGADQVSSGAQALASGSTEQAATVEQLNASIIDVARQADANSTQVKMTTEQLGKAGDRLNSGNEHMGQLTEAMVEINSASNQIASITQVIEDIAFQTNILALNAAIEAARAGSAGKGFAVVADEVRNLAAKSAEAARQTAELIGTSVDTVEKGTQIAKQTAQILHEAAADTANIIKSIVHIEQASGQQAHALEQIQDGLNQVSAVVQTNAATAEENSATSEEMSAQAATLHQEVAKFKLDAEMNGSKQLNSRLNLLDSAVKDQGRHYALASPVV